MAQGLTQSAETIRKERQLWRENFLRLSPHSDEDIWVIIAASQYHHLKKTLPKKRLRTLEVGAGTAVLSGMLYHDNNSVCILDYTIEALAIARERLPHLMAVHADANALPFKDGSFDLVLSSGTLEHFRDMSKPIAEQIKVLGSGGVFYANIIPRKFSVNSVFSLAYFAVASAIMFFKGSFRRMTREELAFHLRYASNLFTSKDFPNNPYIHYEARLQPRKLAKTLSGMGLSHVRIRGATMFPVAPGIPYYTRLLRHFLPLFKIVDDTKLGLCCGMCVLVYGVKE
ncbi:MAG: class I SAM-dependent methyltransferase [Candidatus Woesearchaeota archaeon]